MTDQAQPLEQSGGDDVRADVLAAFEKHGVPAEQEWKLPEEAAPESNEAPPLEAEPTARARDEHGKFVKSDAKAPTEVPKEVPGTDKPAEQTAQVSTPDGAPVGWPADAKAEWSKLSPAIQAAVVKREQEISNGGRQWSDEKRRYEESLAPVRAVSQKHGVSEQEGIKRLVAASDYLDRDPVGAIKWLAENYRVDLKQLAGAPAQAGTPRVDPMIHSLANEMNQLKQTLATREQQDIQSEIEKFSEGKPHFADVKEHMGRLLESGAASSLDDAYEKATWALPAVREKLLSEREATSRAEREKADRERVDKARRGAVSINGSPSGVPASRQEFSSVREATIAAWKQHAR